MSGDKFHSDLGVHPGSLRPIEQSHSDLHQVLAHVPAGIAVLEGPEFRYSHINQRLADINGISVEAHLGNPLAEVLPEAAADLLPRLVRVRETGVPSPEHEFTTRSPRDASQNRCFVDTLLPVFDTDGSVKAVSVIVLDITRRKQAEVELRTAEDALQKRVRERTADLSAINDRLRAEIAERQQADAKREQAEAARNRAERVLARIVEASPDYMWSAKISPGGEFRFHYHSASVEALTGYAPSYFVDGPDRWLATIHGADRDAVVSSLERLRSGAVRSDEAEYRIVRPDGAIRWISNRTVSNQSPDGTIHLSGVASDVTKRKQVREQLAQTQKLETVGRLAGGVAHDFNNLLTVICGQSERLVKGFDAGSTEHRRAESIQRASVRGAALTQRLLAFSRRQPLMPEIVDLDSVLNNVRELVPGLLGDQIDLSITSASDLGLVKADPNQLAQVIVNFAVNARDAMPQGGSLTVAARDGELGDALRRRHPEAPEGRYGIIDVRDTGCGMDQGTLSRLYEPFFTTKEPGQGTGLGLAMAYGVVQESGGYIDVESQVGQGSTFSVYLPHTDEPLEPLVADPEVTVTGGTETLLVVEDTVDVKELAVETLEECGFTVLSAAGAAEALVTVLEQDRPIDLLVTDVAMPEMNGVDLARRLRASRPDLPVLFISGYPDDMLSRYGMQAPRTAMLPKPFLPDRLAVKIRELLDSQ